ncbi:PorT family protein [bacterium]|nr:MAG: PorT family protein [bacterium]
MGVIGGINSSSLRIEPSDNFDVEGRTSFGAGLFMNIQANSILSLQITPMFVEKGAKARYDLNFLKYTEFKADYIEFPGLARLNFDAGMLKPYVIAGPSLGFQLNSTYLDGDGKEVDNSDDTKNIDISLVIGAGLEIELDNLSLFGQLTYNHGLSNIDNTDGTFDITDEIYTRAIGVYVGLSMPFGQK